MNTAPQFRHTRRVKVRNSYDTRVSPDRQLTQDTVLDGASQRIIATGALSNADATSSACGSRGNFSIFHSEEAGLT
jgi:hypothetical protein